VGGGVEGGSTPQFTPFGDIPEPLRLVVFAILKNFSFFGKKGRIEILKKVYV